MGGAASGLTCSRRHNTSTYPTTKRKPSCCQALDTFFGYLTYMHEDLYITEREAKFTIEIVDKIPWLHNSTQTLLLSDAVHTALPLKPLI
jgi:hypothetical protein